MSVTDPLGFTAGVASARLRSDGSNDLAIVINQGPSFEAAAVFTSNKVKAAPVLWSQQAIKQGQCKAVVLNSGGANACTGSAGFSVAHQTAEYTAEILKTGAIDIQVCSTGLIGKQLPIANLTSAIDLAIESADQKSGKLAAEAILTTDSYAKTSFRKNEKFSIGGMIKGAGMLAPDLATMLCVITTDALITSDRMNQILKKVIDRTLNLVDSDGCTSTNDTVLLMSSGASGYQAEDSEFEIELFEVLSELSAMLISDAEGSTKSIKITALNCSSVEMAVAAARAVARNSLVKTAMYGSDPNWGRIMAAIGTIDFDFDQFLIDIYLNEVLVCLNGEALNNNTNVDLSDRNISIVIDFKQGSNQVTVQTNDLSEKYVYENSAYST